MATWTHPSPGGRFWMNNWLTKVFSLYLVEVNFSSDFSFWLSSLWPSAFSVSYLSCDFFFLTMRIVTRSRRVKAVTAPMTIGRRRSISAPKASCLCKKKVTTSRWAETDEKLKLGFYSQESRMRSRDSKCQTLDKESDLQSSSPRHQPESKPSPIYRKRVNLPKACQYWYLYLRHFISNTIASLV